MLMDVPYFVLHYVCLVGNTQNKAECAVISVFAHAL